MGELFRRIGRSAAHEADRLCLFLSPAIFFFLLIFTQYGVVAYCFRTAHHGHWRHWDSLRVVVGDISVMALTTRAIPWTQIGGLDNVVRVLL